MPRETAPALAFFVHAELDRRKRILPCGRPDSAAETSWRCAGVRSTRVNQSRNRALMERLELAETNPL